MKTSLQTLFSFIFVIGAFAMTKTNAQTTVDFTTAGATTWVVPAGVTSLTIETWGAGGSGGRRTSTGRAGGGGGGAYSRTTSLAVSPGQTIYINVGAGGDGSSATPGPGGDSWARALVNAVPTSVTEGVLAKGGNSVPINTETGANGGSEASGVGNIRYSGGNGASVVTTNTGGGGSSAGTSSNGVNSTTTTGATAPSGGGNGGNGNNTANAGAFPGVAPGGAGGGARSTTNTNSNGGNGATGKVSITYNASVSNTVTTGTILGSPFCVTSANSAAVSIPFTTTGTFNGGNVFTAQLSNATGSFASPVSIGTGASPISATIPAGTASGTAYRIRVVASDPSTIGTDNGTNLQIISAPINVTSLSGTSQENQVPLSWTNPTNCVDQILVVASTSSIGGPPTGTPSANANYGSGTALLSGFAVYSGTGTSVTVTGLTNGTPYFFKVFTRTGTVWSSGVQTSVTPATPPEPGEILIGWDMATTDGAAASTSGNFYELGVSTVSPSGVISRGSGLTAGAGGTGAFRSRNFVSGSTLQNAIDGNSFLTFTVTPTAGYRINISSFDFTFTRGNATSSPDKLQLRSSTDGFATFQDYGQIDLPASTSAQFISIITPGLVNLTVPIEFRLYGYEASNNLSTGNFVDNASSLNAPYDIAVMGTALPNTWTGAVSNVWNVAGNWRDGIPSAGSDVLIPQISNPNFNPVIAALNPSVGRITLNTGALLIISGDGALTVNTEIKNNGVVNVNSGGSLVQGVNSSNTGTGTYNIRRQGHNNSQYYNFWSTAVQNASIGVLGGNRYYFDPTTSTATTTDDANDPGWKSASGTMTVGQGYASTGAGLVNFSGNVLNNAPTAFPISASINKGGTDNVGNNLIGNPFPSAISISQFLSNNSSVIQGSVYFWNQQTTPPFTSADYTTVNASGYVSGPNNQPNYSTIPSGQGFFVLKTNTGVGTVQFRNSQRVAGNNAHFYDVTDISRLWLSVTTPQMKYNETLIAFKEDATAGVDNMYDSKKLSGNNFAIALHSFIEQEKYAIQTLPKLNEFQSIQLGLLGDEIGTFTISLKNIEQFNLGTMVVLEDTKLNHFHNLSLQAQYAYERTVNDDEKRFRLHFYAPPVSLSLSSCEQNTNSINVNNSTSLLWNVVLENENGAVVGQTELNGVATYNFENLSTGNHKIKFSNASGIQFDLYESVEALDIADASFTINNGQSNILPYEAITAQVNNPAINATYEWYLNGLLVGTSNSVSFAVSDAGSYTLRLVATTEDCRSDATSNFSVDNTTTSINQLDKDLNLRAFPNPANEMITILWNEKSENFETVRISDLSGRTIERIQLSGRTQGNQIQLDLRNIAEGMYLITLEGKDVRRAVKISVVK